MKKRRDKNRRGHLGRIFRMQSQKKKVTLGIDFEGLLLGFDPNPLFTSCVTLSKVLDLSVPQMPHL